MNIFNIAMSGARAAQANLNVMAMNNANVFTPGYSRQRLEQSAIGANGPMSSGNGVQVDAIRRVADQYLISQVWTGTSDSNYYNTTQTYLTPLESILGKERTSLGNGVDKFFAALSAGTSTPESKAERQQMISEAQAMATRFNSVNNFINTQQDTLRNQRATTVDTINTLSGDIANYNKKITELEANGVSTSVLRDQRDELVKEMSGYLDVKVIEDDKGSYTLTLSSGQPLVSGTTVGKIRLENQPDGSQEMLVGFSNTEFSIDKSCGGSLGGLNDYESGTLKEMQASVQSIAENMAKEFNEQLAKGFDLNGNPGKPLFFFDPTHPDGMLQITDITAEELALSGDKDAHGDGSNLAELIKLKDKPVNITGIGNVSIGEACVSIVSSIGITSRQNQVEATAADNVLHQAQLQRDNLSGVNSEEEALNLLMYTQAYQSNLKVISTGDQIFSDLLSLFG